MNRNLLCLGLMMVCAFCAGAQSIGVELGYTMNTLRATVQNGATENQLRAGFRGGVVAEEPISDMFAFQYGLLLATKGGFINYSRAVERSGMVSHDYRGYMRTDYVELPLNILYKSTLVNGGSWFAGGGPYLAAAFGGIVGYENAETTPTQTLTLSALYPASVGDGAYDDFTYLDMGMNVRAGYELANGFYAAIHGSYGFLNTSAADVIDLRNAGFGLSVGYMLR